MYVCTYVVGYEYYRCKVSVAIIILPNPLDDQDGRRLVVVAMVRKNLRCPVDPYSSLGACGPQAGGELSFSDLRLAFGRPQASGELSIPKTQTK